MKARLLLCALGGVFFLGLTGCGQKGGLYMPVPQFPAPPAQGTPADPPPK